MMRATTTLRQMLQAPGIVVAPGAYDGLSARLVERQGFEAVYMTGAGTAASVLGQPDLGLTTLGEMTTHAANIAGCVSVPVIADADTGYGNPLNVIRTVREYERAGVAGIHLEETGTDWNEGQSSARWTSFKKSASIGGWKLRGSTVTLNERKHFLRIRKASIFCGWVFSHEWHITIRLPIRSREQEEEYG